MPVEYSVMTPAVVMRPILLPVYSVNHRAPSGPARSTTRSCATWTGTGRTSWCLAQSTIREKGWGMRAWVLGEPQGAVRPGSIYYAVLRDMDRDGKDELVFGAINNPGEGLGHAGVGIR